MEQAPLSIQDAHAQAQEDNLLNIRRNTACWRYPTVYLAAVVPFHLATNGKDFADPFDPSRSGGAVLAASAVAAGLTARRILLNKQNARIEELADLTNRMQGSHEQPFEFAKKGRVLRWYGFDAGYHAEGFDPVSVIQEGKRFVLDARRNGIDTVAFSMAPARNLASEFTIDGRPADGRNYIDKSMTDKHADADIAELSVESALQLLEQIEREQPKGNTDILVDLLRQASPGHSVLPHLAAGNTSAAKRILRQRIEDAHSEPVRQRQIAKDGQLSFTKAQVHAELQGARITQYSELRGHDSTITRQLVGSGSAGRGTLAEQTAALLQQKEQGKTLPVTAIETALWAAFLEQQAIHAPAAGNTEQAAEPLHPPVIGRLLDERPSLYRTITADSRKDPTSIKAEQTVSYKIMGRAIGGFALMLAATSTAFIAEPLGEKTDEHRQQYIAAVQEQQPADLEGDELDKAVRAYADAHPGPISTAVVAQPVLDKVYEAPGEFLDSIVSDATAGSPVEVDMPLNAYGGNGRSTSFGNVGLESNKPVWYISSAVGADQSGYWTEATFDTLRINRTRFGMGSFPLFKDISLNMVNSFEDPQIVTLEHTYEQAAPTATHIVTGDKDVTQYTTGLGPVEQSYMIPLATKEGTQVTSMEVTFPDMPATLPQESQITADVYQLQDNTYWLKLEERPGSQAFSEHPIADISYTLGPSDVRAQAAQYLKTVASRDIPGYETEYLYSMDEISPAPGIPLVTRDTRADEPGLNEHIRSSNTYSLNPFDSSTKVRDSDTGSTGELLDTVADAVEELDSLNCNMATLEKLIYTKGLGEDSLALSAATGYSQGDNDGILSERESHMWTVDANGAITDPTPYRKPAVKPPETSNYAGLWQAAEYGAKAAGVGLVGLTGFKLFRRGRKRFDTSQAVKAEQSLAKLDPEQMEAYMALHKWLLYAPAASTRPPAPVPAVRSPQDHMRGIPAVSPRESAKLLDSKDLGLPASSRRGYLRMVRDIARVKRAAERQAPTTDLLT